MHWKRMIMRILMVILGIVAGGVLAVITTFILNGVEAYSIMTTVNGWSTTQKCNIPGNGILLQAACSSILPMANVPEEAVYWTTTKDSTGQKLNGQHDYILHFPAGQLPPNDAFWSLTMTNLQSFMVNNPINRYSVSDRSGLVPNADGSIDFIFRAHLRPVTSRTGCLRRPVTLSCGCVCIYPARQFSMANTTSHRSSK